MKITGVIMIIGEMLLIGYSFITLSTCADELWNINNPRPFPKAKYHLVVWEEQDFIKMKDGSYVLRPKRKVDNKVKECARKKYYAKKRQ